MIQQLSRSEAEPELNVLPTENMKSLKVEQTSRSFNIPELVQFSVTSEDVTDVEGHAARGDLDEVSLVLGEDRGYPGEDAVLTTLHV